jgi:hypothetical protein
LPFEVVPPNGIIEVNNGRIVLFPQESKKDTRFHQTYILDTKDTDEIGKGLITKGQDMLKPRSHNAIMVKAWSSLIYVIGGLAEGHCERYDANLN